METKEYYFTETEYISTIRQAVLDALIVAIRILVIIEAFGFLLYKTSHLRVEQLVLCLVIELVYQFIKREKIEISIAASLHIKEDEILIKRVSMISNARKESVLSIPWHEIRNVFVSDRYLRIQGCATHKLYIDQSLVAKADEKNMIVPLQLLKKEEIEEICSIFIKGAKNGGDYEK